LKEKNLLKYPRKSPFSIGCKRAAAAVFSEKTELTALYGYFGEDRGGYRRRPK
jgi:hypothetical protein